MKKSVKIAMFVFALALIASCSKEEIVPATAETTFVKKGGSTSSGASAGTGTKDADGDGVSDGDITDPENDLDFE